MLKRLLYKSPLIYQRELVKLQAHITTSRINMKTREEILAYKKAYREANKAKLAEKAKAYREANRENILLAHKAYREANKEKISAGMKIYREANKEKIAAQNKIYKDRVRGVS
jgi:hypothetical protein